MRALFACLASLLVGVLLCGPSAGAPTQADLRARLDAARELLRGPEYARAHAELQPLVADVSASGDRELLIRTLILLAVAKFRGADYAGAFATYERALPESRALGDKMLEARVIWGMAQVRKNQGRYAESLRLNAESREVHADRDNTIRSWMLEGALRDLIGEHRPALDCYERARALLKENEQNFGLVHSEMSISYRNLGEYARAREMSEAALRANRRNGWRYGEAVAIGEIGNVSAVLGDYDEAIRNLEEALAILQEVGDLRLQAYAHGRLAAVWWARQDGVRAAAAYQKQFEMAERLGIRQGQAIALEGLGEIALAAGDYAAARERFTRALKIERADGGSGEAALLVELSTVERRDGNLETAGQLAAQALRSAQEAENPESQWQARLALARSAREAREALTHLRAGVEVINSIRGRLITDSSKVGYLDARQELFHELVATLLRDSKPMQALEAAEAARGRAFSDLLAARTRSGTGADGAMLAQLRDEEARLRAQGDARPDAPELRAELTRTRAATEARIEAQVGALREQRRELASLVVAEPVSEQEILATRARLGATIVEYLVTADRLFIWVVGPAGEPFATSIALERKLLRQTVRDLHAHFNGLDAAALRNPASARDLLRQLHRWTLEPIAARLPRKAGELLLVVPHDALLAVPFAALEDSVGRSVLTRHTIASVPSIAALRYTAGKKRRATGLKDARLLALADPIAPPDAAMEPLPGARAEVRQIGKRFAADRRLALEGSDASERNAKQLSAGRTNLHFAVHGLVRDDRPWDSALVLAPGDGEDGWLRASEVFDLTLAADLVVLSGCSTGAGRLSGDGILGLGRAFIYAGTPSVLVSQWDVSDVATAFLMESFYAELQAGRTKAQALRAAQLAAQKRFQHPALWAAFTLIGEPT